MSAARPLPPYYKNSEKGRTLLARGWLKEPRKRILPNRYEESSRAYTNV